jgi:hypothetical protein
MANAADYLRLDTSQLLNTYKLRTRNIEARRFVATNVAPNYVLSVTVTTTLSAITLTPSSFTLQPNASAIVTVEYDSTELELLSAGTLEGAINLSVSAAPIVVPEIPTPPSLPPIPEAPRQIISRVQLTPSNFTFTEVNETNQYTAVLLVDDAPVAATFEWSLENNLSQAFSISDSGVVRVLKDNINTATVSAKVLTPRQYASTTGLAIAAANIPILIREGGPPVPTTGNLRVVVDGLRNIGANVSISGLNQTITETTTFSNIPAGTYTVTPNVVSLGGTNYNPSGGGEIYVSAGTTQEIRITYIKQLPPDVNSIQIMSVTNAKGAKLTETSVLNVGNTLVVTAQTYRNGVPTALGPIKFNVNGTVEGVIEVAPNTSGEATARFKISQPGLINISAINDIAGSVTGRVGSIRASNYSIRITSPNNIIAGQCTAVTAVVLQDGVETSIPVEIDINSLVGRITTEPCGVTQPAPVGGGGRIIDTGISAGNSTAGGFGGATSGGQFNQIVSVDQGINAI